jgi:MoaA/NifB/PqqE/SkfB family radical SAM enzyme
MSLYTRMKVFHYKDKLDSLPRDRSDVLPPLHIRIKPTNQCNHNCRYCAYRAEGLQLGMDMRVRDRIPQDKMREIIEDVIDMGVKAVTFSGGGEPLFYPHIAETLRRLADSPVRFATLTNGALLSGEAAELLAHHGTWVRISLDGWDGPSYARYRQVEVGAFSRLMDNIAAFKKLGGPCYLGASLIVDSDNAPHVAELLSRLCDAGLDSVKVSPCIVSNDGEANNVYHAPFFALVKDEIARAKETLGRSGFEIYDAYHELDRKFAKPYGWCPYQQILPVIGADQNIYPCQDKAYNLAEGLIGSIAGRRFKDFWLEGKDKFFRIDPSRHCNHHCVANEKNRLVLDYLEADPGHLAFV